MKKLIVKISRLFLIKLIGKQNIENTILLISRLIGTDLLILAYQSMGILKYTDNFLSGEQFVISTVLKKYIKQERPILFDVGANVGTYSKELRREFPNSKIYAFEPNINSFQLLICNLGSLNINCFNTGFDSKVASKNIYTYANAPNSAHASIYKEVLIELHNNKNILEIKIEMTTIDEFCKVNQIKYIDFLKIDTEGNELAVLTGAKKMIEENKIGIIQFEFNEMNIVSRVFLKDFYKLLSGYNIYRLDSNQLIPLLEYNSKNEIFKFQNFLAIHQRKYVI